MYELTQVIAAETDRQALQQIIQHLCQSGRRHFLRNEILHVFEDYGVQTHQPAHFFHASPLSKLLYYTHELIVEDQTIWLLVRSKIAEQEVWRIQPDLSSWEQAKLQDLLDARDRQVGQYQPHIFEIDVHPFYDQLPSIRDPRNIGQGLSALNRYLCHKLSSDTKYWIEVLYQALQQHDYDGISLMIGDRIRSGAELVQQLKQAIQRVSTYPAETPYREIHPAMQELGFDPGWGNTAGRVQATLELLLQLLHTPEPAILEAFVSHVPAAFRVVLVSVYGWVSQEDTLNRPERTGQVIYVLEQARHLEQQLIQEIQLAGLDMLNIQPQVVVLTRLIPNCEGSQCDLRLEKIDRTQNAWILRVPFQSFNPKVTENWISRFEIWPYLESFALDAEDALLKHLGSKPNLIIGHYSDGNLVAFLLARRFRCVQCNVAHYLEKPRYLFSDLYWQELDPHYHFSAQFTADLIGMNAANFTLTSSHQEIVGTPEDIGQYESYKCFTMPGLYHVIDGVNLFSPQFNLVPPGVEETLFFPYSQRSDRDPEMQAEVEQVLFYRNDPHISGTLEQPEKQPIFAIASISSIKNLAGLVECFGQSLELQKRCNLILLVSQTATPDEADELKRLRTSVQDYQLEAKVRLIKMRLPRAQLGEAYRVIADRRGVFVNFARYEAFGLAILEAMASGLPTFITQFGGSVEIVREGIEGFHINPTELKATAQKMVEFFDRCAENPQYWHDISDQAIKRVEEQYNWQHHAQQVLLLTKIYGFWNYVSRDRREALERYLEALFYLLYKPRADQILQEHLKR